MSDKNHTTVSSDLHTEMDIVKEEIIDGVSHYKLTAKVVIAGNTVTIEQPGNRLAIVRLIDEN